MTIERGMRITKKMIEAPGRYVIGPVGDPLELWFVFDKVSRMFRYYYDEVEARGALKGRQLEMEVDDAETCE